MRTVRFRTVFMILGIITGLCLLSPLMVGLFSAAVTYDGRCYGFTDGSAPCTRWEYARNEMAVGSMLAFSPAIFLGISWLTTLGIWAALHFQPGRKNLPLWQAVLIPLAACVLGASLIYVIPLLLGMRR